MILTSGGILKWYKMSKKRQTFQFTFENVYLSSTGKASEYSFFIQYAGISKPVSLQLVTTTFHL